MEEAKIRPSVLHVIRLCYMWFARLACVARAAYFMFKVNGPQSNSQRHHQQNKKVIRRWDSERELSLRRQRARTKKYNRSVHKFRHRSTRLCVGTHVYQIQWNNAIRGSKSFKVADFCTNREHIYDFLLVININLPPILHRFQVMADYSSNFR